MTLGDDIALALPGLRAQAESMMLSRVVIRRDLGSVWDETSGTNVSEWQDIYEGPARLRFPNTQPQEGDAGGERIVDQAPTLSLPIATSGGVRVDDIATVTENAFDPSMVGLQLRVTGLHTQTHSTARRLPVEVVSRG